MLEERIVKADPVGDPPGYVLVRQTPEARWDRAGIHNERGRTSFRLLTETIAGHDQAHLEQLRRTIATVRG